MISKIRNIKFTGILWGLLALYFLNISIDVTNSFAYDVPENLNYNKQESLIEVLVEKVFGFENAIAEYDEQDTDQSLQIKKNITLDVFIVPRPQIIANQIVSLDRSHNLSFYASFVKLANREIHSPPPDFIV